MQILTYLALVLGAEAAVKMAGVNIAGCDIGVQTDGSYDPTTSYTGKEMCPSQKLASSQIKHFKKKDGFNIFRLPVAWQQLINNDIANHKLDENFMKGTYDKIVNACLGGGNYCIIDIHNYARYDGQIVGESSVPSSALANTWSQLAKRYGKHGKIVFGVMNEPWGVDIGTWAGVVQDSVNAIRKAGAKDQMIFLPGSDYTTMASFISDGSADALNGVKNPDNSKKNLIFEVHQYFGSSGGKGPKCSQDLSADFKKFGDYLKQHNRQAFIGEIGGGNNKNCIKLIGDSLKVVNQYSDQYLGWTSWAAGTFPLPGGKDGYELSEVPTKDGKDQPIVAQCFAPKFKGN